MERELTNEQSTALHAFWWHMCKRIARDANIQWYCGSMTETLRLAVEAYGELHPDMDKGAFEREMLSSNVAGDADICRARKRIEELESE
jgi:hypothetical protein